MLVNFDKIHDSKILEVLKAYGIIALGQNLLIAIVLLLVGLWLIKRLNRSFARLLEKKNVDPSLRSFLLPLVNITLKVFLIIMVIHRLGIEATSLIALMTSAGLAVGLALQGSLSNFAGGVLLLLLKPFRVNDFIQVDSFSGTVMDISLFYTSIKTTDGQKVVIPNSKLSNSSVTNFTSYPLRRINTTVSVSYDADIQKVKEILLNLIHSCEKVLNDPQPSVDVLSYGSSSIDFFMRGWVKREDFFVANSYLNNRIKDALDKEGISIPYPQLDVHIQKDGYV